MIIPTNVNRTPEGSLSMDVFSTLYNDRNVMLTEEITSGSVASVIAQLITLDSKSHDPICLYINSPGGSVQDGLALYDVMNSIESEVYTIGMGMIASMASVILSAGTRGHRYLLPSSFTMIHEARNIPAQQMTSLSEQKERMNVLEMFNQKTMEILAENCSKTLDELKKDSSYDHYFTADEAVTYGLADHVGLPD